MATILGVQVRIAISAVEVRVVAGVVLDPEIVDAADRILAVARQDRVGGDHLAIETATRRKKGKRKGNTRENVVGKAFPISRRNT